MAICLVINSICSTQYFFLFKREREIKMFMYIISFQRNPVSPHPSSSLVAKQRFVPSRGLSLSLPSVPLAIPTSHINGLFLTSVPKTLPFLGALLTPLSLHRTLAISCDVIWSRSLGAPPPRTHLYSHIGALQLSGYQDC